jgi:hypothetical protein
VFDTVLGLPVHALVIHAVVVLGPVTGLVAIAYAVRPPWRRLLRLPVAVLAVVTALSAVVAVESGQELEQRLAGLGVGGPTLEAIGLHSERGELARNAALVLAVVALAAVFLLLPPVSGRPGRSSRGSTDPLPADNPAVPAERAAAPGGPVVALVTAVVLALAGVGVVVTTALAGHSGSSAVWSDIGAA